jgi:hypothetical protein
MRTDWVLALVVACAFVGCAGLRQFPEGPPNNDHARALQELDKEYADTVDRVYKHQSSNASQQARMARNEFLERRMAVVDAYYKEFQAGLVKENVRVDFLIALVGIGVGGAGALASETASQILSVVSGGLAGGQAAYSKSVLYDKAMSALLAQMQASRKAVAAEIYQRWNEDIDQYPMWMARTDVEAYAFAGSLPGAILATAADAKVKDAQAEDKLARLRSNPFAEDESSIAIARFLRPPDGKRSDQVNRANASKLRQWIDKDAKLAGLPFANFITNPELRAERERAIKEIPIP